jgi:predicted metal-binding protein
MPLAARHGKAKLTQGVTAPDPPAGRPASTETDSRGVLGPVDQAPNAGGPIACARASSWKQRRGYRHRLFVCTTCRAGQTPEEGETVPGTLLAQALSDANACDRRGAPHRMPLGLHQWLFDRADPPGSWTYVYGRLSDADAPDILAGAAPMPKARTASCHGASARHLPQAIHRPHPPLEL